MPKRSHLWLILSTGVLLTLPTWLNVAFGDSLGIWWAPFPMWIFFLLAGGLPHVVAVALPTALFLFLAFPLAAGKRSARVITAWYLGSAWLIQLAWTLYVFASGIRYYGLVYTCAVLGVGTLVLVASTVSYGTWRRRREAMGIVLSAWLSTLWLAWCSVPWLGEAI